MIGVVWPRQNMIESGKFGCGDEDERVFAHSGGSCHVSFSPDVGSDGALLAFPAGAPLSIEGLQKRRSHRGAILDIAVGSGLVATAGSDSCAYIYRTSEKEPHLQEGQLMIRTDLPIRAISLSSDEKLLAIGSESMLISLISIDDPTGGRRDAPSGEHKRPISCLAFDPKGEFLASIDLSGQLIVWEVASLKPVDKTSIHVPSKYWPKVAWSQDGQVLAVTGEDSIKLIQRGEWTTLRHLSAHLPIDIAWSLDGSILLSYDESSLALWNWRDGKVWRELRHSLKVDCMALSPNSLDLAFVDKEGVLHHQRSLLSPSDLASIPLANLANNNPKKKKQKLKVKKDTKDDEEAEERRIRQLERKYMLNEADDEDDDEGSGIDLDNTSGGDESEDEEDNDRDEEGLDSLNDYDLDDRFGEEDVDGRLPMQETTPETPISRSHHIPFQPGATDPQSDHRFMVWNLVGLIVSRQDEAGYRSIDIEFHDKLNTRPIRFIDDHGFSMGTLSKDAALFSTGSQSQSAADQSTVHYMAFETWNGRQTWTYQLGEGESVLGVALNDSIAFVATSHGWIRSFTATGLQLPIITFGGDFVTMVAGNDRLLVVTHHLGCLQSRLLTIPQDGTPSLDFEGPIGRRADLNRLLWAGISDSGLVACMDQTGIVYGLTGKLGFCWTPIGDFSGYLANGETVWPIFLDRNELSCVLCKSEYPPVLPRPIMTNLPMKIPLIPADETVQRLYEPVLRNQLIDAGGLREKELRKLNTTSDKHVLELIQIAIKADKHLRALELCQLFFNPKSYDLAIQLARHHRLVGLADKIESAKDRSMAASTSLPDPVEGNTPKLPVKIQQASPSVILADLTPGDKPSLRAVPLPERPVSHEGSPSAGRNLKRNRMELVADENDLALPDLPDVDPTNTDEVTQPEPGEEDQFTTNTYVSPEKKPRGLMDMLSRLTSIIPSSPISSSKTPVKAKQKENLPPPAESDPALKVSKKKSDLQSLFGRKQQQQPNETESTE